LSYDDLIEERYRGIRRRSATRRARTTREGRLFDLLEAPAIGMTLTESYAMSPAASVSGLYFSSPHAKYFSVGRLGRDQISAYAARKGMSVPEVERWLRANLGYLPS